ncbi:MAG TPA: sugar phosphate isomerase/epimerase [bacterium]|nr:sugar phosphate isomerase/epimerase [bacterium]HOL34607.1 sugar phosphate isomerase/epimerase [bacterium]HPP08147.1 sugar phosphate isomerase/epimerase [bacterium]
MKIGVADYGMNVWDGGLFDIEQRLIGLKEIGYQGTERLIASSPSEALFRSATYKKLGMDFATCLGPTPQASIQWTSALGKNYVWTAVTGNTFDVFCRQVNHQVAICKKWGICVGLHNHLGSLVETQEQLEEFLRRCPDCGLILDTAHLAAAGGDPVEVVKKYGNRLVSVHLKDWLVLKPEIGLDKWTERGRFCELGAGNIGLDNIKVMEELVKCGYDGWVFVEQDTHLQDPLIDLAKSRNYLKRAGF